uniref:Uncharacterized protein MANES_16G099600 n=1 Tax=Rhizophora mucronata TaxID=61149 RepID=A0A2P2MI82_RHIMU
MDCFPPQLLHHKLSGQKPEDPPPHTATVFQKLLRMQHWQACMK